MSDPHTDDRAKHPIDVVPPRTFASPADLRHPASSEDVPFWKPARGDVIRQMGWRWIFLLPLLGLIALAFSIPWRPSLLQFILVGGGKITFIIVGGAIGLAGTSVRAVVRQRADPFCIHCGYDLIGLPDNHTCPECGRPYSLRLIDEYRRDPHWFIQRYKARGGMPTADIPFNAGPSRRPRSRDGT